VNDYLWGLPVTGRDLLVLGIVGAIVLVIKIRKGSGNRDDNDVE
jgi:hypothetical protein